ncbi:hypothetical protein ABZ990_14565 [Streptomyces sp. NPDC046203]|uniref:hypothetical protein n=1 Tax=Streptomyces sp. NPDC046203 TaxID=3154602 RepID=UPI0033FAD3B6
MTWSEGDWFAAGHESEQESLYAYRIRGRGRGGVVLSIGGVGDTPDRVLALPDGDRRRMPVFATAMQARRYAERRGRPLAYPEADTLELVRVQHWLADPVRRRVPAGAVLEAWNFFEDLTLGLAPDPLAADRPWRSAVHDSAYEKLFGGECDIWTPEEQGAVRELLTDGVELWNSCPVVVRPRVVRAATAKTAG